MLLSTGVLSWATGVPLDGLDRLPTPRGTDGIDCGGGTGVAVAVGLVGEERGGFVRGIFRGGLSADGDIFMPTLG